MKQFLLAFCTVMLTGCATTAVDDKKLTGDGLPIHGHFCGPNVPYISTQEPTKHIAHLKSINPVDKIDAACQEHDICYMAKGGGAYECDSVLLRKLASMKEPRSRGCRMLKDSILSYFKTINPKYAYDENSKKTALHQAWSPVENVADAGILALSAVANGIYKLQESGWVTVKTGDRGKKRMDRCY